MPYDVTNLSKADKKIVTANPNKTQDELLELGLSKKGYKMLLQSDSEERGVESEKEGDNTVSEPTSKITPVKVIPKQFIPVASGFVQSSNDNGVWLYNKNTGLKQYMNRTQAEFLVRTNGNIYEIK